MEHEFEPADGTGGPFHSACAFQPGDTVSDFDHGDRKQEQGVRPRLHPANQRSGSFLLSGRSRQENVRVDQVHDASLKPGLARWGRVSRGQVSVLQVRGEQQTTEGRDIAQTIPFVDPEDHRLQLSVARDDCRFPLRRFVDQDRQPDLGLAQLDLSHRQFLFVTNVVILWVRT